ncbi:3-hydroxyacyl-ACP dehydratase FabZ family protein [Pediococcus stilesii]|uniref:3-hydroxymyristoyl 3-hydroxydecanoyl-(Acyl carrier protein) dehydratase n=1 Tax=Pediococcus stilesii TaxID=331679 RepID=A0A0R2L0D7_9LACO|nr:3-hydroxyacyl-ACP dehydratase FabZ family protein [Pediococcus stilesii]KRN95227.1 3-hydroxymyristoyl 3-hydroxydecanoyl-(acyl carrier protein) dehydratase [Pediococcus stilesii]
MKINVQDIIPQRPPFQMIDHLIDLEEGKKAVAEKKVTINEWFFSNDNELFMPEPLLIEALAQTGACALLSSPEFIGKNAFFGGIRQAEFSNRVIPGNQLTLTVELIKMKRQIGTGHGVIINENNQIICEADLTFIVG